jgi:hypothetical protein
MGRWRDKNRQTPRWFYDAVDSLLAKRSDTGRDDGEAAEQVLTQLIVERANAFGPDIHG